MHFIIYFNIIIIIIIIIVSISVRSVVLRLEAGPVPQ